MAGQDNLEVIVCSARLLTLPLREVQGGKQRKRRAKTKIVSADSSMILHTVKRRRTRRWPVVGRTIASSIYVTPRLAGM